MKVRLPRIETICTLFLVGLLAYLAGQVLLLILRSMGPVS